MPCPRRPTTAPVLTAFLAALGTVACARADEITIDEITVDAVAVALHENDASVRTIGRLRYRAGFHLTGSDERFGGFSGLHLEGGGAGGLLAVSDRGHWLEAELRFSADGTLEGIGAARLGPLADEDGRPVTGRGRHDSEELVELPGRGFLVSFEGDHRLALHPGPAPGRAPLAQPPEPFPFPGAIHDSHHNNGMEAVTRLGDGRILAFAEDEQKPGAGIPGWVSDPGGATWEPLVLNTSEDLLPTGAATLPSGDVVVILRSYSPELGFNRVRIGRLAASSIVAGARLDAVELGFLEPPLTVDNFEAIAVGRGPAGEEMIYLLSDDNLSDAQRTLLFQFELIAEGED